MLVEWVALYQLVIALPVTIAPPRGPTTLDLHTPICWGCSKECIAPPKGSQIRSGLSYYIFSSNYILVHD